MSFVVVLLLIVASNIFPTNSDYAVCEGTSSIERQLLEEYISRLASPRSSEVLLSVQLVDSAGYHVINSNSNWLRSSIQQVNRSTHDIGKMAYHAMAALSICEDPRSFGDVNLLRLVDHAMRQQFHHREEPRDGWYSFALSVQTLCVASVPLKERYIEKILNSQKRDGSFCNIADTTSQISIALLCARDKPEISNPMRKKINLALYRAKAYLSSKLVTDEGNYFLGNRYSSPEALLALHEIKPNKTPWFCSLVARSTLTYPRYGDSPAFIARSLQALGGASVLQLMDGWSCKDRDQLLGRYTPMTTPTFTLYCPPAENYDEFLHIPISVSLTIISNGNRRSVTLNNVTKDKSLLEILHQAQCDRILRFKYKMTSWGPMLTSLNGRTARIHRKEYWSLLDGKNNLPFAHGIAGILPSDCDDVIMKLTRYD